MKMQVNYQTQSVSNSSVEERELNQREHSEHLVSTRESQFNKNSSVLSMSTKLMDAKFSKMLSSVLLEVQDLCLEVQDLRLVLQARTLLPNKTGYKEPSPNPIDKATDGEIEESCAEEERVESESLDEEEDLEGSDEEKIATSAAIDSGLIVNPLGGCDVFDEFRMVALFRGDSVSVSSDDSDPPPKSKPSAKVVANPASLPINSGTRQSVDDVVIPQEEAVESSLLVPKKSKKERYKEKLLSSSEEGLLLPSYISMFSSQCGPPVSATPDGPLAVIESDPAGARILSEAVYIKHPHPQHLDLPEGAFPCFLPVKRPSVEYWDRVVW